uniref:Permease n=1 Tax=Panagrellus redivivus TaxID=6233 RepID=A0A7E4VVY3_PANRE
MCNVLYIDKNKTKIYVNDTVVVYCANSDSYDKFIPYISGPYTKISIRGKVRWDQVKRLIHPNVKEVQILAKMELRPEEFDEFAVFVAQHLRGWQYKFSFTYYMGYTLTLSNKVKAACRHIKTHDFFHFNFLCGLVDWRMWWFQIMLMPIIIGIIIGIPAGVSWILIGKGYHSAYCVTLLIFGFLSVLTTYILDDIARDSLRI